MKKIANLFLILLIFLCTGCTSECLHEKEIIEEVESTCLEQGYKISYCSICDKEFKVNLPLGKHQFKDFELIQELTYTQPEIKNHIWRTNNRAMVAFLTIRCILIRNFFRYLHT